MDCGWCLGCWCSQTEPCFKPSLELSLRRWFLFTSTQNRNSLPPQPWGRRLPQTFPIHHSSTVCLTSLYNEVDAIHSSCSKNTGHMTYNQLYEISTSLIKRLKRKVPTVLCRKSFHWVCWCGFRKEEDWLVSLAWCTAQSDQPISPLVKMSQCYVLHNVQSII